MKRFDHQPRVFSNKSPVYAFWKYVVVVVVYYAPVVSITLNFSFVFPSSSWSSPIINVQLCLFGFLYREIIYLLLSDCSIHPAIDHTAPLSPLPIQSRLPADHIILTCLILQG